MLTLLWKKRTVMVCVTDGFKGGSTRLINGIKFYHCPGMRLKLVPPGSTHLLAEGKKICSLIGSW